MNFPFSLNILKIPMSDLCVGVIMGRIMIVIQEKRNKC